MTVLFDFTGRSVVATGTSSGIGAAVLQRLLEAGATVDALDLRDPATPGGDEPVRFHRCDLGLRTSIDASVAELPQRIDGLINCAGIPNGSRFDGDEVMRVNWLGLRHLTEALLPRMGHGGAVVHVASTAGREWRARTDVHAQLMAATTFEQGRRWIADHPDVVGDGYVLSKEAVQYYTLWRAVQLLPRGIRMNSVCPGVTDTALLADFRRGMGDELIDHALAVAGRPGSPAEMAPAMLFLADHASSSYMTGVNLTVDGGTAAARATQQSDPELIWGRVR